MIRIASLIWTLLISLLITSLSFFYIRGELRGFPFSFAKQVLDNGSGALLGYDFNIWLLAFDIVFWWLLFSILVIILKNYVFDL